MDFSNYGQCEHEKREEKNIEVHDRKRAKQRGSGKEVKTTRTDASRENKNSNNCKCIKCL